MRKGMKGSGKRTVVVRTLALVLAFAMLGNPTVARAASDGCADGTAMETVATTTKESTNTNAQDSAAMNATSQSADGTTETQSDAPAQVPANNPAAIDDTTGDSQQDEPADDDTDIDEDDQTNVVETGWGTLGDGRVCYRDEDGNPVTGEQQLPIADSETGELAWFYFDDDFGDAIKPGTAENGGTWETFFPEVGSKVKVSYKNDKTVHQYFAYKYGYLEYLDPENAEDGNFWNKKTADYIEGSFYALVDTVVKNIEIDGTKYESAQELISTLWGTLNLYSKKNLYAIGKAVGKVLSGIDEVYTDILGLVLGIKLANFDEYLENEPTNDAEKVGTTYTDDDGNVITYIANENLDRTAFIDAIAEIIAPAGFLLDWLLAGKSISFLYDKEGNPAIHLEGANGFDSAIVPILEALGRDMSGYTELVEYTVVDGVRTKTYKEGVGGVKLVEFAAKAILGRLEAIIASENPVQTVVAMLPELIYFINANGLGACVTNLVAPAVSLVEIASSFMGGTCSRPQLWKTSSASCPWWW